MPAKIYFITTSTYKFQIATEVFKHSGFSLQQKPLDTPEIQSTDIGVIAAASAVWAANKLKHPVFVTDAGCFITALHGFPGPFIKFINHYLTAADFLRLMVGKKNRQVVFKDCLAYCEPGKKPKLFYSQAKGLIAMKAGKRGQTPIDAVFIPQGFDRPASEIPHEQMVQFWKGTIKNYKALITYLNT